MPGKKTTCTLMPGEYWTRSVNKDVNSLHVVLKRKIMNINYVYSLNKVDLRWWFLYENHEIFKFIRNDIADKFV